MWPKLKEQQLERVETATFGLRPARKLKFNKGAAVDCSRIISNSSSTTCDTTTLYHTASREFTNLKDSLGATVT